MGVARAIDELLQETKRTVHIAKAMFLQHPPPLGFGSAKLPWERDRFLTRLHLDEFLVQFPHSTAMRAQRGLIERALERAKGNKSQAARLLGLTRAQLYSRLEKYGVEAPR